MEARTTDWEKNRHVNIGIVADIDSEKTSVIGTDIWHLRWQSETDILFLKATESEGVQIHNWNIHQQTLRQVTCHPGSVERFWIVNGDLLYMAPPPPEQSVSKRHYVDVVWDTQCKRQSEVYRIAANQFVGGSIPISGCMVTANIDAHFSELMSLHGDGRSFYLTCRKSQECKDVVVFKAGVDDALRWEMLPLPTNAVLWAISPDGQTLLLNWDDRHSEGYSGEAPALHTIPAHAPSEKPQRIAADADRYFLSAQWTQNCGIIVRYIEGTIARIGRVEGARVVPYDFADLSILGCDVNANGTAAVFAGGPDTLPRLVSVDLWATRASMRSTVVTHVENRISFDPQDDERQRSWAWGRMQTIRWNNEDGVPIEGVLYTPDGYQEGAPAPLLVVAHGGPGLAALMVRRDWEDCWIYPVQQLLAKGIVVLKPNYHCSDGYGRAFHDAHRGSGGPLRMMLADVESGVAFLVKQGIADPQRVGLAGWSNGGSIAAMAAVKSTVFRAISCGAGAGDHFIALASSIHPEWHKSIFGGFPWDKRDQWVADCATWQKVEKRVPTLIQHGSDDPICTIAHANALYFTLQHQGVPVTLATFPKHGHGVFAQSPKAALTVMSQNLKWFSHQLLDHDLDWDAEDPLEG
ncbi:MAG: prolyl oligopeptidase family serine peptidase [Verrucomicrobia bacterium]|nr:prolyl oligopeptidase family serine peptidase [Verrucomicrobiota bacterium]